MTYCKKCGLKYAPRLPRFFFYFEGDICSHCLKGNIQDKNFAVYQKLRKSNSAILDEYINGIIQNRGNRKYDCVVGFSGGKDSAYLLMLLKEKYPINILAVTIKVPFMADAAMRNIESVVRKIGIDHFVVDAPQEIFVSLFKYWLLNSKREGSPIVSTEICSRCSNLIEGMIIKEAYKRSIPLVLSGLSPNQNLRVFFEISKDVLMDYGHWFPKPINRLKNNKKYLEYLWNPSEIKDKRRLPKVYFPFHAWDYNVEFITSYLVKKNVLSDKATDRLETNCKIWKLMGKIDNDNIGIVPFTFQTAELARRGLANREMVIREQTLYGGGEYFKAQIDDVLNMLGIDYYQIKKQKYGILGIIRFIIKYFYLRIKHI